MPESSYDVDAARDGWQAAVTAVDLALSAPAALGGVVLRGRHGPVRDALLARIGEHRRIERLAAGSADEALDEALDVAETLSTGRAVRRLSVLDRLDAEPGSVLLIIGAERLSVRASHRLARWLDTPGRGDRAALIALDESDESDEADSDTAALIDGALGERLALHVRLPDLALADLQALTGTALPRSSSPPEPVADALIDPSSPSSPSSPSGAAPTTVSDERVAELVHLGAALGIDSARAALAAVAASRALAAVDGRDAATLEDCALAARLILAPRAVRPPDAEATQTEQARDQAADEGAADEGAAEESAEDRADDTGDDGAEAAAPDDPLADAAARDPLPPGDRSDADPTTLDDPPHADHEDPTERNRAQPLPERLVEAVSAALPPNLLGALANDLGRAGRSPGRRGGGATAARRGRPAGVARPRSSDHGRRLDIVATLKAAAPWQRLRSPVGSEAMANARPARLAVRPSDFRIRRYVQPLRTTTVFIVDASGSAAMHRIGEAKGALESVLSECYVRRDRVALISFRGANATLELPPTRSLARARRALVGLAAGGGTPIATGLELASDVLQDIVRGGERAVGIIMSDGRANVARDGMGGRAAAQADAERAADRLADVGARLLFVDTAPRPRPVAAELAARMRARYLPLPLRGAARALPQLLRP